MTHASAARETTAEARVRACLDRIAAREPQVQAWEFVDEAGALAAARELDRARERGPLHGLPVAIKDIMDTADMPASYGSPIYAGHRPAADAACVAILRAAGAVVLGKTVTTEFATIFPGKTRHPFDPARTPGGSSSGSAAAVADGMAAVGLGTQTMGSVIRPAAYCGVVGFKPSFGLINRAGIKPQAESIDTVGVIARSVDEAALVAAVLAGAPPAAFAANVARPPRVLVYRGPDWSPVEPAADAALEAAARALRAAGATVTEAPPQRLLADALAAHLSIVAYELARAMAFEWAHHRDRLSPVLTEMITLGLGTPFADYLTANATADAARAWIARSFAETDCWLTVSAPGEAPLGLQSTGDPVMNRLWSLLHVPVVTVRAGRGPAGMPLGVQIIGAFRRDAELLAAARWIERILGDTQ
jgi:Asp-tRNA(Asn)/Glu-tRNA(Gln) amidotransferase A subunit family amidase